MKVDMKELRLASRMSQAALAVKTGIDRTRLSFAENGYLSLDPEEQAAIRREIAAEVKRQGATQQQILHECGITV